MASRCQCLHTCDDGQINGTCILEKGGYCFTNVRTISDINNGQIGQEVTYGCFPPDVEGMLQCRGNLVPHQYPQRIICCQDGDYCNIRSPVPWYNQTYIIELNKEMESNDFVFVNMECLLYFAILLLTIVLASILIVVYIRNRRNKINREFEENLSESEDLMDRTSFSFDGCKSLLPISEMNSKFAEYNQYSSPRPILPYNHMNTSSSMSDGSISALISYKYGLLNSTQSSSHNGSNFTINHYRNLSSAASNTTSSFASEITQQTTLSSHKPSGTLPTLSESSVTSGSGSGTPHLVQKTLAREIQLIDCIGNGRFGNVWLGSRKSEDVAVKIFFSRDEASWKREIEIYTTVIMRHENILGFLGADVISQNGCTELWLVTEFIELGSLYDYLNQKPIFSKMQMLSLMSSIINGVCYLHTEYIGTTGKPAIAHRDIKSKNILMRSDHVCCIADFGLAVTKTQTNRINIAQNHRVGTKRYMAPELLNETMAMDNFDYYRLADIYSLGLVFWEILNRLQVDDVVNDYHVPFHNLVPSDPSFEDMLQVVYIENTRPPFNQAFMHNNCDPLLDSIQRLISECWMPFPSARLPSLRIKKTVSEMLNSIKNMNALLN